MISGKALAKETHAKVRHLLYWMAEHIPTRLGLGRGNRNFIKGDRLNTGT